MDLKLEVVVLPVADVDRARTFYLQLGWRLDADATAGDSFRVVQLTPPGSQCSIQFGTNMTSAAPGSAQGLYLIVADIEAARDQLTAAGVAVSEVFHEGTLGDRFQPPGAVGRASGPARARQLRLVRLIQRPGRQHLAAAGDHHPAAWPGRSRLDGIRVRSRPGGCAPARRGRAWRAREADRRGRPGLARLVRGVHGGGAGRDRPADLSTDAARWRGASGGAFRRAGRTARRRSRSSDRCDRARPRRGR